MKTLEDPQLIREIKGRIDNLRADSPRQWGTMSAHQMLCHLADSKRGVMGAKGGALTLIRPATENNPERDIAL